MVVPPLDRKLLRDLSRLRGQVATIALVVACGIASYVSSASTYESLDGSRQAYYERARFADVFVHAKRVPSTVETRLERVPGVARVHTRIRESVSVPLETLPEPARADLLSAPPREAPPLNRYHLRRGRLLEPGRSDEALVLDAFAEAHELEPGDQLPAVINGKRRSLRIVGTVLSPEYVFAISGGEIAPDPKRFGVLWMSRDAIAPAFELDGAFNDVAVTLQPGASEKAVIAELDRILDPYGGLGAHGRDRQPSAAAVSGELQQLETMALFVPAIFLGVAAFLLNVVLSRLVHLQRSQIAALKALGYSDRQVGAHFLKLVTVVVLAGTAVGVGLGAWLGQSLTQLYTRFFKFPVLAYHLDADIVLTGFGVSLAAAVVGALTTVRGVTRLPPAEAMRPAPPPSYRPLIIERLGLGRLLSHSGRMVWREVERRPLRLALSSLGIAMAVAILVTGRFFHDSINYLMDVHFEASMREDVSVTFSQPVPGRSIRALDEVPGVLHAEGIRMLPVRYVAGPRERNSLIMGYPAGGRLRALVDKDAETIEPPREGILLSRKLAEILAVEAGQDVRLEVLEGQRPTLEVHVVGLVDDMLGLQGHMQLSALADLLKEQPRYSMGLLSVDPERQQQTYDRLREMPNVVEIVRRDSIFENFRNQSGEMVLVFTMVLAIFAAVIAVGVVYNNARVSLSMRSRDLASLRVLGFTRREISAILLGELAIQVLVALPLGLAIGTWLSGLVAATVDPESYRIPVIISSRTYAFAAVVTLGASLVSALMVRRKLDRLDLIAVLKTRE